MSITHKEAQTLIQSARNRAAGKPLANNTRLYGEPGGDFDIKYHNTFIVTIHTDGTYTLRNGGYNTSTTLERIRRFTPCGWQQLQTERGEWYVGMKPVDRDPRPTRVERSIPRPFETTDPGDEPVKDTEGCVAGQLVSTEHVNEAVECWRRDMKDGDELVEVVRDGYQPGGDYDRMKVLRSWTDHVWVGEASHAYKDAGWREFAGLGDSWSSRDTHVINDDEAVTYVQCSHCKAFDAKHERWRMAMHGDRWGRRFDGQSSYATYAEMIDRWGSMEGWQEAYIADFRARRDYLKADREWVGRNRVPFYDGITVDSEGWTPRVREKGPSPAKLRRHEAAVAKMKKRIDKYVAGYIEALKAGKLAMPGPGDCWYCALSAHDGKPLGDAVDTLYPDGTMRVQANHDHLDQHMKDRYYVPSLAVNALRERGYKDVGIYMWLDMDPIRPDRDGSGKMVGTGKMGGKQTGAKAYDTVRRDMRRYMTKRLVPEAPTS